MPPQTEQPTTQQPREGGVQALSVDSSPLSLRYRARNMIAEPRHVRRRDQLTRVLNVLVALIGITITGPVMLLVALAVKLTSRGPVIFTQKRVGLDRRRNRGAEESGGHRRRSDSGGKIFTIYKFRTMRVDGGRSQKWASKNDPRITPIGKFLRATRLDELPQFFNVLKGDMNIVGPRPEQPDIFAELHVELGKRYRHRQRVLPGITGLAQVNLGYDTDLDGVRKKVDMDLQYIRKRSASKDLEIMAKTVPVMVLRKVWMD
jgi:lipopolysaccharide/colanic/teichoic acid biosynthesis glycosyltransferase